MFMFRVLHTIPYSSEPSATDVIAMIHSFVTSNLLVIAALILSARQFIGRPIECMLPTDFTPSWVQYAENYCWAQPSYFVPFTSSIAGLNQSDKAKKEVSYYQWMPFFLLFEAACFKLPCLIWKYFASQSGMRIGEILRLSSSETNGVPEVKNSNVNALGVHLNGALRFHKTLNKRRLIPHKILRFLNVKYSTYYVTFIYFVAKIAFLLNVALQAKLLERYVLPKSEESIALKTWKMLVLGNETWKETGIFPRVTLCDVETRDMGNVQQHTVQCLLLMNIFTEKIFLIFWAWYIVLSAFTALNVVSWVWCMWSDTTQLHFVLSHLEMSSAIVVDKLKRQEQTKRVQRFLNFYLGSDGLLILFLVSQHSDVVFTADLIAHLWLSFNTIEQQRLALKQMNRAMKAHVAVTNANETVDGMEMNPLRRRSSFGNLPRQETKKFDSSGSDEDEIK